MSLEEILTATREVAPPDATTLTRGRDAALTAARHDLTSRARIARRRARRRMVSIATVFASAAAVAVFVATIGSPSIPNDVAASPPAEVEVQYANASQIINTAATSAGAGSDLLGDARYWKVVSEYAQSSSDNPDDNGAGSRTVWQGIDGPGVVSDTFDGGFTLTDGHPLELPQATLSVDGHTYTWREINAGVLSPDQLRDLLTMGGEPLAANESRSAQDWHLVKQAGELLSETPAAPAIRQALWKELAELTGATTTGRVTDTAGREGWNLTFTINGYGTQQFIVDPATGAILQTEVETPASTYRVTYLESGPTNTAPAATATLRMPTGPAAKPGQALKYQEPAGR